MRTAFDRLRLSLALLTERRAATFIVMDALFLFAGVGIAFGGTSALDFYPALFLFPSLAIGVPMLADAVAVERRSGTLDLAMTSPGAQYYFERRVGAAVGIMIAQGWLGVLAARLFVEPFPVAWPLMQVVVVALFIGSVSLNWSVRLKTTGAVMFATYATIIAFIPWFFSNPILPPALADVGPMTIDHYLAFARANLVLGAAAVIFYLYARQRLTRPELIIS